MDQVCFVSAVFSAVMEGFRQYLVNCGSVNGAFPAKSIALRPKSIRVRFSPMRLGVAATGVATKAELFGCESTRFGVAGGGVGLAAMWFRVATSEVPVGGLSAAVCYEGDGAFVRGGVCQAATVEIPDDAIRVLASVKSIIPMNEGLSVSPWRWLPRSRLAIFRRELVMWEKGS